MQQEFGAQQAKFSNRNRGGERSNSRSGSGARGERPNSRARN